MTNTNQTTRLLEKVGAKEITIETGFWAKQSGGSVTLHLGETVLLSTATAAKTPRTGVPSFVPLTVEYKERTYAAGRIPGGFFKREGRPREKEILSCRLTDRSVRPLFPEGYNTETNVSILVLSTDQQNDSDVLGIIAGSAALTISDIPFNGPVGAVRVGRVNGEFVLFPTFEERETGDMDLVVAGKKGAILMVEGGGSEIPEETFLKAMELAQKEIDKLCDLQTALRAKAGKEKWQVTPVQQPAELAQAVESAAAEKIRQALRKFLAKSELEKAVAELKVRTAAELSAQFPGQEGAVPGLIEDILYRESRSLILKDKVRADGRSSDEIRPITIAVGVLPRTHGSALFTRGQTQALCTATLGTPQDMQIMDVLEGEFKERFMLHYNFPGFATGEVKMDRGPSRREIGHGYLAKRALEPLLPNEDDFAYTIRIVSDILESNGSSSMASVCGGSLSLFDAGVPLKSACAGIAMGLVMEKGEYCVLSDILGMEDHLGDMDFKVAGTKSGITAFQMDVKIEGISMEILKLAVEQARKGRLFILDKMEAALSAPKSELSAYAPRLFKVQIPQDKIGALIGPGGKNIRKIQEETGAEVEVEDDGSVYISGVDAAKVEMAKQMVLYVTAEAEVGKIYKGKVVSITEFGAFVEILPGKEGLLHISQIETRRIASVRDVLTEGQEVEVKVLEIDNMGKMRLSRKAVLNPGSEKESDSRPRPNRNPSRQ